MKNISLKRPTLRGPIKTHETLTILVVAHSDSMQQKHPSGLTKTKMAEIAINTLYDRMRQDYRRACESFARVEAGTGFLFNTLATAYSIASAWCKQPIEGCLPHHSQVILPTDGSDDNKEKTKRIIEKWDEKSIPLFIYHLPSESNPKEGYDYCTSLAPTHSMYEVGSLSHVFCLDDMDSSTIDELFYSTNGSLGFI